MCYIILMKATKVEVVSPDPQVEKAVVAHLVRVLDPHCHGVALKEIKEEADFQIPQGPMLINGQWL